MIESLVDGNTFIFVVLVMQEMSKNRQYSCLKRPKINTKNRLLGKAIFFWPN